MRIVVLILCVLLTSCGLDERFSSLLHANLVNEEKNLPLLVAHRGYSDHAPENTIPAFQEAIATGNHFVELDFHETSDGVPVVLHDDTLDRTTDGVKIWGGSDLNISAYSWQDIQQLDAGRWFSAKFAGAKIPSLAEAVDYIQEAGGTTLVEHKVGSAKNCADILEAKGYADKVMVQSFDWEFVAEIKAMKPGITAVALGSGIVTEEIASRLLSMGVAIANWKHADLDANSIEIFHRAGLKVFAYTVDDAKPLKRLTALGVDGFITNNPSRSRKILTGD